MDEALINQKKWTDFLKSLPEGTHSRTLPETTDLDSLASVGYRLNKQGYEMKYHFILNYRTKVIYIKVTKK